MTWDRDELIYRAPADPTYKQAILRSPFVFPAALMVRWPGVVGKKEDEVDSKFVTLQPRRIVIKGEGFDTTADVLVQGR